jgi:hypothetical protein
MFKDDKFSKKVAFISFKNQVFQFTLHLPFQIYETQNA